MPEPGQTPQPAVKRGSGPAALAYGDAAEVNDLVGMIPPDNPEYAPSGEGEQFLFSPTDRPKEPFSHGLPFGQGAAVVPGAQESDDQLVARIAGEVSNDPGAPKQLRDFANRALNGM